MATERIFGRVTVNQGPDDVEALELKSSDVAHGVTTLHDTDTYFAAQKNSAADGGVLLRGIAAGTTKEAIIVQGVPTAADTTKSTAGRGAVRLSGALKSGTGVTSLGANANILSIDDNGTTRFMMDADGDSHQDVGTAWTNFDVTNDVEMLNVLSAYATRPTDPLRATFQKWLAVPENRDRLEALGLATFNDDGSIFVNMSRLTMLLVGAQRQSASRIERLEAMVGELVARLLPAPPQALLAGA